MGKKKIIPIIIVIAIIVVGVGYFAFGSSNNSKTLTVWSYLTKPEVEALQPIADKWGEEHHMKVELVYSQPNFQEGMQAMKSPSGPDAIFGIPNDNIGTFVKAGLLSEQPKDLIPSDKFHSEALLKAGNVDGVQYGTPIAEGTVALFYNKKLVKEVPTTMEQLVKEAKKVGFEYPITNFYYSYGFIGANGGYVFKDNDGKLDPNDIGLANAGAIKGYEFLNSLVKDGLINSSITANIAKADFEAGKVGFYISGPWDVPSFKSNKDLDFGVAKLPTLDGKSIPTFSTVQLAVVNKNSKKAEDAWSLIKYLDENGQSVLLSVGNRIPVLKSADTTEAAKNDPYLKAFEAQAKVAQYMPNIPEIQAMWEPAGNNLQLLIEGKLTPKEAADNTVKQMEAGIKQQ